MPPNSAHEPHLPDFPPCLDHSGIVKAQESLALSIDRDRQQHHEDLAALHAQLDTTNAWLQKITEEALRRWPAGAVRLFALSTGICGALFTAVVFLFIALHGK